MAEVDIYLTTQDYGVPKRLQPKRLCSAPLLSPHGPLRFRPGFWGAELSLFSSGAGVSRRSSAFRLPCRCPGESEVRTVPAISRMTGRPRTAVEPPTGIVGGGSGSNPPGAFWMNLFGTQGSVVWDLRLGPSAAKRLLVVCQSSWDTSSMPILSLTPLHHQHL